VRGCLHNLLLLYVQTIGKVAREWRDHEEAQRYASTAVVRLVQADVSPSEAEGRSLELQRNNRMMMP
jgi:hypothetical protein